MAFRWTTEEQIGEPGGFGIVYKSRKKDQYGNYLDEEQYYAKKKLTQTDQESIERFRREVRLCERLNHPRIVTIEGSRLNNEPYFYIMPLYKNSFEDVIDTLGHDYNRIKKIFNSIFDGIEYLHNEGVFHRDLKPANILMNSDEDLVISDFGLGLQRDSMSARLTSTKRGMGTEFFSSPEQLNDVKNADHLTDIFSLGRMIYLCFVNKKIDTHADTSKLPPVIEYVVRKSTMYDKKERFQSINDLRKSFNSALDTIIGVENKENHNKLMDRLNTGECDDEFIDELAFSICSIIEDTDEIHNTFISINQNQFQKLVLRHPDTTKRAIKVFKSYITDQGWPFSYTDVIGKQCYTLFHSILDIELRTDLIYIIVQVGSSHNRYYVMDLAREILTSINDKTEALELKYKLNDIEDHVRYLNISPNMVISEISEIVY